MKFASVVSKVSKALVRKGVPVDVTNLMDLEGITANFGFDRGLPIDRFYIRHFLTLHSSIIKGNVLEVAERSYSMEFSTKESQRWILNYSPTGSSVDHEKLVVTGDLVRHESLPKDYFDCFICTQTLSSIYELASAMTTVRNILKPGGSALITFPGIVQVSSFDMDRWGDYWRFTSASVKRLVESVFKHQGDYSEFHTYGNLVAANALLRGLAVEDLPNPKLLLETKAGYPVLIAAVVRKSSNDEMSSSKIRLI